MLSSFERTLLFVGPDVSLRGVYPYVIVYWGYMRIMEKKIATAIMGYIPTYPTYVR